MTVSTFDDIYDTGTITLTAASATFSGSGVVWSDVVAGDILVAQGLIGVVDTITGVGFNGGTLKTVWGGAGGAGLTYNIIKLGKDRFDTAITQAKIRELLLKLAGGLVYNVACGSPDPDLGEDGDFAINLSTSPWTFWKKVAGVWVIQAGAFGGATYDTIAALQAATVQAGVNALRVLGYYAAGDGGEGVWKRLGSTPGTVRAYHKQSADGAWWIYAPTGDQIELRALGAKGDLSADAQPALQAAVDFAAGRWVHASVGQYLLNSGVTSTGIINLYGDGNGCGPGGAAISNSNCTQFMVNFASGDVFSATSNYPSNFWDFQINTAVAYRPRSSGAAISINGPGSTNANSKIISVGFAEQYNCITFYKTFSPEIAGCFFVDCAHIAVSATSSTSVEGAGGNIHHNTFFGTSGATTGVGVFLGVGYTQVHHNLFVGYAYAVQVSIQASYSAGAIRITDNWIENQGVYGIIASSAGAGGFVAVLDILRNKFSNVAYTTNFVASIAIADASGSYTWLWDLTIAGNGHRHSLDANKRFIWIQSATNWSVEDETIENLGAGSTTYGIDTTISSSAALVGRGAVRNCKFTGTLTNRYICDVKTVLTDLQGMTFATLPSACADGSEVWVTDGTPATNPGTGSGSGAIFRRIGAAWLGLGTAISANLDADGTLAANSDARVATQKAVVTYFAARIAALDVMVFKGVIDCSANPNYPAADAGATYRVSVAGKIGGASGTNVEAGDLLICITDGTASGTQAGVGANWEVAQANLDGAVIGPASATSGNVATYNGTTGKIIQDGGKALPSGPIVGTTDTQTLTNKTLTAPVINGGTAGALTSFGLRSTGAAFDIKLNATEVITGNRTLTIQTNDGDRVFYLAGNFTALGAIQLPAIAQGDLWYGSAAGAISALAKNAGASRFLSNTGTSNNPAWAQPAASDLSNGTTGSGAVILASAIREKLTAARTYYVRTDGSDSNTGLVDSAGGGFLTVQKAVDAICSIDLSIYQGTVQIDDGTYTGAITLKPYIGSLAPIVQGNNGTPANVLISTTSADAITNNGGGYWKIRDLKIQTTTAGSGLVSTGLATVAFQNINFGACAVWQINPTQGGKVIATGNYAISGSAVGHIIANIQGGADLRNVTITYSNTPNFSFSNFTATTIGLIVCNGMTFTNGGTVTGQRYTITGNSDINTSAAGATYIPGNSSGTTSTGGQYE